MNFLRRAAPLAILASGQVFVIVSGGFDLSVGSLVTLSVLGALMMTGGDPALTWGAIAALYGIGLAVGLINGLAVALLKVPSIIATLGMLLSVNGVAMMWSGGSPRGYLPDNFRAFGRLVFRDVPVIGTLPLAVIVLVVFAAASPGGGCTAPSSAAGSSPSATTRARPNWPASRSRRRGSRPSSSRLSAAVTAGIMLGGFGGVSTDVGQGLELQAIAACVIGGAQLMGGQGRVVGVVAGALSLFALFTLLNLLGLPQALARHRARRDPDRGGRPRGAAPGIGGYGRQEPLERERKENT